jgi:hypothetical protein
MLIGISVMLAMRTGIEEFSVSPDEIDAFTRAAGNVARHYNIETTQKTLDWIALVGVSAQVFGTRAFAIALKAGERRRERPRNGPATVHHLHAVQPGQTDGPLEIRPDMSAPIHDEG